MASIKSTIPFSFDEIYSEVEKKFTEKGYDIQPGSNTMQLANAMSYLISMLNTNTAVNINENLLTLARKRDNILQDARLLGYEPGNKISYKYQLELTLPAGDFVLPKYTKFVANGKNYYYFGDIIQLTSVTEGYKLLIDVKEGNLIKSTQDDSLTVNINYFSENGIQKPQYYIDVPYTNIEDDGIEAFLTYYDDNGILYNKEVWKKIEKFTVDSDTILDKRFYRLNLIGYNTPRIYFKLPNTGDDLRIGTKVELNILESSGSSGEMLELPKTDEVVCEVTAYTLKIQGTEEETSQSIKDNAPLFWNSANRAVTKNDYTSIVERLTLVDRVFVWDGNNEYPKVPGKIWFSFIPSTKTRQFLQNSFKTIFQLDLISNEVNWFLEDDEINSIFEYLESYKIPTMEHLNRHPVYLDFSFDIEILKYDITSTESSQNQKVFDIIDTYFSETKAKLENFNTEFFLSNLIKRIDNQVTDITGLNIKLKNDIVLYNKYIVNEGVKKIIIPLGLPYETMYNNDGDLIYTNLPSIDTELFLDDKNLFTDWSGLTGSEKNLELIEANIYLEEDIVGKYTIFNKKYILVELFINGILTEENIEQKVLNILYKNSNILISKNTLPRLKRVNFI